MTIIHYEDDIHKNTLACDDSIFFGNGQHCGTIWFSTVPEARKFIRKKGRLSGQDAGLCEKCKCHYSIYTKDYEKYTNNACSQWKEDIKK